jgi:transposase-like protein
MPAAFGLSQAAKNWGAILQVFEQRGRADHRRIKQRIRPMLGLKRFETAAVTIRGIPNGRENQKTTVQPQSNNRRSNHRSGNLGRGPGRLKSAKPLAR